MNILYIDESGVPSKKAEVKTFSMVGLDISIQEAKSLIYDYLNLHRHYYPYLYKQRLRDLSFTEQVTLLKKRECKYILNPREYKHQSKMFMLNLIDLCQKHNARIFGIVACLDKITKKEPSAEWIYPYFIHTITKIYSRVLKKESAEGLIILDSRNQAKDDTMALTQSRFLLWNKEGRKCDNIAPLPFFTASHISIIIQIAHFFSYITNMQYHCVNAKDERYDHISIFWQRLSCLFYGMPSSGESPFIIWDGI